SYWECGRQISISCDCRPGCPRMIPGVLPIRQIVAGAVSFWPSSSNIRRSRSRSIVISLFVPPPHGFIVLIALAPLQPCRQPFHRVGDVSRGARIAEADEAPPVHGIEIGAGGRGNARLLQHAAGEIEAVAAKTRYVGIEIEGAVDGQEVVKPGARQAL